MKPLSRLRAMLACLSAVLLCACESYPTMQERTKLLGSNAQYFAPPTPGPAPLVILMSGCGGLIGQDGKPNTNMEKYAKAASRSGAYAIIVDSLGPRGIDFGKAIATVCSGAQLRGNARSGDALAAEALAETHWSVDFTGIILAGWSHGSWAVMELLAAGPDAKKLGNLQVEEAKRALTPDAVVLFYPYCGFLNGSGKKPWSFQGPVLLVTAENDSMGSVEACRKVLEGGRPGMAGVNSVVFPGVTHAFDEESQAGGSMFVYNPEASAKAEAVFSEFVVEQVRRLDK
jgi:dienelactone hydrolase